MQSLFNLLIDSTGVSEFRPASPCQTSYLFNWKEKTLKASDLSNAYFIDRQGAVEVSLKSL
jgi:hypothetical protein